MHPRAVHRVALIFVLVAVGAAAAVAAPAAAQEMDVDHTVRMSDQPGMIDATSRVHVPPGTAGLRVTIPADTEVYETRGFSRIDDRTYEWTRSTDEPFLAYRMGGNVTVDRGAGERYLYAVTDDWALVRSPSVTLRTPSSEVEEQERYTVDGEGAAGQSITFLGSQTTRSRTVDDQRFRFVVPAAADMRESPRTALDSLAHASRRIEFGQRDAEVFVVVAPTSVEWAATGLQRGDADLWVRDVEAVDSPRNAWVHEYVHTRQDYEPTAETRWTVEGMAEYYAALLPYEAGHIDYETFRGKMEKGTDDEYDDVRLDDPGTWEDNEADYEKGALVFGALDRRLHAEAAASMDGVFASLGDDEATQSRFLDAVEAAGSAGVRSDAREYTETTATPTVWNQDAHVEAFGGPLVRTEIDGFARSGPYRNGTVARPELVTGETLETTVRVGNDGTAAGEYDVDFAVDGRTVDSREGQLEPGETATLSFEHTFEAAGEYELTAGITTATAVVEPPADPRVTELSVEPQEPARGEAVRLRATVESTADRPANDTIPVTVDGDRVDTLSVAFAGTTTVETTVTFDRAGGHMVGVGDRTSTVTVRGATVTAGTGTAAGGGATGSGDGSGGGSDGGSGSGTATAADGDGVGVAVAALALLATRLLAGRRYP